MRVALWQIVAAVIATTFPAINCASTEQKSGGKATNDDGIAGDFYLATSADGPAHAVAFDFSVDSSRRARVFVGTPRSLRVATPTAIGTFESSLGDQAFKELVAAGEQLLRVEQATSRQLPGVIQQVVIRMNGAERQLVISGPPSDEVARVLQLIDKVSVEVVKHPVRAVTGTLVVADRESKPDGEARLDLVLTSVGTEQVELVAIDEGTAGQFARIGLQYAVDGGRTVAVNVPRAHIETLVADGRFDAGRAQLAAGSSFTIPLPVAPKGARTVSGTLGIWLVGDGLRSA